MYKVKLTGISNDLGYTKGIQLAAVLDSELIIRDYSKEGKDLLFQEGTVEICITNSLEVVKDFTDGGLMIMFLRRLKIVFRA